MFVMDFQFYPYTYNILFSSQVLAYRTLLSSAKPIMVTFGTNQGSITPLFKTTTARPKEVSARSPAPVFEASDDVPNPIVYKPLVPHQYRSKIYSFKPNPNLILGTPIDQKYTPALQKGIYKQQIKPVGRGYTGPQVFERQAYEFEPQKIHYRDQQYHANVPQQHQQQLQQPHQQQQLYKYVPQIGVIYSSGLRYYVPQIAYDYNDEEQENSVYDKNDVKAVYHKQS